MPIIEWLASQTYTLEEQRFKMARRLATLEQRHGFMFVRGKGVIRFKTRDVADPLDLPVRTTKLKEKLVTASPWLCLTEELKPALTTLPERELLEVAESEEEYFEPPPGGSD